MTAPPRATLSPDDLLVVDTRRIPPTPWRNGGGATRELFVWPDGAGAGDWRVRVSLADIERDGPFSAYPGIDRWFAVVGGAGVRLALPGGEVGVTAGGAPLAFDGADAPGCTLIDGPTRDLNLMCHRGTGQGLMQAAQADVPWPAGTPYRGLFTTGAATLLIDGVAAAELAPMALLFTERGAGQTWALQPAGGAALQAWWMAFTPHAAP
jgi:environmental stress-induced protein Ves